MADEVLILDSGSTDKTTEIAEKLGAKVVRQDWLGFGRQKQKAVDLAKYDWILSLDSDEALSSDAQTELTQLIESKPEESLVYSFPRITYHMGRALKHGGNYPDFQQRFFHRKHTRWSEDAVHERLQYQKQMKLKSHIDHWSFATVADQINTINRYSSLRAQMWFDQGKKASLLKIVFKPLSKFFEAYILKLGFLDGYVGFEVARVSAFSYFLRLVKLRELWRKSSS